VPSADELDGVVEYPELVRVFHTTDLAAARSIKERGFRDSTKSRGMDQERTGVWVADRAGYQQEAPLDSRVLILDLPEDELAEYEMSEEGDDPWREFLVPASILNTYEIVADCSLRDLLLDERPLT
jgi:hypothetical protein